MAISSILFICLGNICRSPLAEGVFSDCLQKSSLAGKIRVDSAGTGGWHIGNPPDERSIAIGEKYGIDLSNQRCRKLKPADFRDFDLILGMDHSNLANANAINTDHGPALLALFCEHAGLGPEEIPDPYYGGPQGFEQSYQLIRRASQALLARLGAV